jgi:biotin carboxyl carrier protein
MDERGAPRKPQIVPFELEAGGRRWSVAVRRAGDGWIVAVNGRERHVRMASPDGRWSMLVGNRLSQGPDAASAYASYEIAVETSGPGERVVHVNGRPVAVQVPDARARFGRGRAPSSSARGAGSVSAPMPGRVVKVLVRVGETVSPGQGLIVVEAMKMENEVRAPRRGTVADVRVAEGQSVEAGTLLLTLDPQS